MIKKADKNSKTLMKRRTIAIIVSALLVLILAVSLPFVLKFSSTTLVEEGNDKYYIMKKDGVYAMYDANETILPKDEQYGYYVTLKGTLYKVNSETGEYEIFAIVDTQDSEVQEYKTRLLLFPRVEKANILSIDVHNSSGNDYTFCRYNSETGQVDKDGDFIIKGAALTAYDQEMFGLLYFTAGYTLSTMKIRDPIVDENGEFSEYGLVPETRLDEEGNEYLYEPAYYVLTDVNGVQHKVIVGDLLVNEAGYYVQYVDMSGGVETKRHAVYVLDTDIGATVLAPIETYVTPMLTEPMSSSTYTDVEDFTISVRKENASPSDSNIYDQTVCFSFIDMALRENTMASYFPYEMKADLGGYYPSSDNINLCLEKMYQPTFGKVIRLTPSPEEMVEYGFYAIKEPSDGEGEAEYVPFSPYTIAFKYDSPDADDPSITYNYSHIILISDKDVDTTGNYYTHTSLTVTVYQEQSNGSQKKINSYFYSYDMIVEVSKNTFDFLTWDSSEWISTNVFQDNISYLDKITLESPDYNVTFDLDNSLSDLSEEVNSRHLFLTATDSRGNQMTTFGLLRITDIYGNVWSITPTNITVVDSSGKTLSVAKDVRYYANNAIGDEVLCRTGLIDCAEYDVEVNADTVRVIYNDRSEKVYIRYDTSLFRDYYQSMLYTTIVDSYELDESALEDGSAPCMLTVTITTKDVDGTTYTKVYKFYKIPTASRKAYLTIDGRGGFFVQTDRVNKLISDAQKFLRLEPIEPDAKN